MQDNRLEQLVAPELEKMGFEFIKLEIVGSSRSPVVRLYIDKPGGLSIGDCSLVSRSLGLLLDEEDPFPGRFLFEVSSPGSDRPLVTQAHFQKFEGEMAKVRCVSGPEKITYTGHIRSCNNGILTLDIGDGETVEIELSDINKASLVGREYKIDKKKKPSKRKKRAERGKKHKGDQE